MRKLFNISEYTNQFRSLNHKSANRFNIFILNYNNSINDKSLPAYKPLDYMGLVSFKFDYYVRDYKKDRFHNYVGTIKKCIPLSKNSYKKIKPLSCKER